MNKTSLIGILLACLALPNPALGQWIGKQTGCYADEIAANPNRPTVSNPAHVTQYGVVELEYGFDRFWPESGIHDTSTGGLIKFGLLCDVELRLNTTSIISQYDGSGDHRSVGDNWIGTQIRIHRQQGLLPTLALGYSLKIPTASTEDDLGSGHVDHSITVAASEIVRHVNFDFNVSQLLTGNSAHGFDAGQQIALAFSRPISHGFQFAGEFYGETQLNADTPGFASSLWALTYTVRPRLVIDGGFEAGLTSGGPHRHAFFGATYAIANVYQKWRRR